MKESLVYNCLNNWAWSDCCLVISPSGLPPQSGLKEICLSQYMSLLFDSGSPQSPSRYHFIIIFPLISAPYSAGQALLLLSTSLFTAESFRSPLYMWRYLYSRKCRQDVHHLVKALGSCWGSEWTLTWTSSSLSFILYWLRSSCLSMGVYKISGIA